MLAPDAERRVTAEKEKKFILCVGVSATLRARAHIDATDAPTQSTLRICAFFSAVNTNDLDLLSLVRSVKGTLVAERTELSVSA